MSAYVVEVVWVLLWETGVCGDAVVEGLGRDEGVSDVEEGCEEERSACEESASVVCATEGCCCCCVCGA